MLPMALHLIGLCVLFHSGSSVATPLPLYSSLDGSTDEEEVRNWTSSLDRGNSSYVYQTTPAGPKPAVETILGQVVNFLEENMLLMVVSGFFILLVLLVICGAIFMSHKRNVNAYYPSSFPSKMYVDHSDKAGGVKPFNELPEKPVPEQQCEPVDSHKQLQADIMRAARSLRTHNKCVDAAQGSGTSHKDADHSPDDNSEPDGGIPHQKLDIPLLEKEPSEPSDNDTAAAAAPQPNSPECSRPEDEESQGPPTGRSLRPSSLHIHNDSATLQLIAGEKTAF